MKKSILLKVTEEEKSAYELMANIAGKTVTGWIKEVLAGTMAPGTIPIPTGTPVVTRKRLPEPVTQVALPEPAGVPLDKEGNRVAGHFTIPAKNLGAYC